MISIKSILVASLVMIVTLALVFPWNQGCSGNAACISGNVTEILDGYTLKVNDMLIRLTLISTPEIGQIGGMEAKEYLQQLCSVGSPVLVDEDDGYITSSYDRMNALIHCNGKILNEEMIRSGPGEISDQFCPTSEFSDMNWASEYGC